MNTDQNLLCGVLALQADLIRADEFVQACALWTTRKDTQLVDLMLERGWLVPEDKAHLSYLVKRKLQRSEDGVQAKLAEVSAEESRSLNALEDKGSHKSSASANDLVSAQHTSTVDRGPETRNDYSLINLHAVGGIGRVWLAQDSHIGRNVALKDLRPGHAADSQVAMRFLREARITGQLEHPGVAPIYELGWCDSDQRPFYTMRFVKGPTLTEATHTYHENRVAGKQHTTAMAGDSTQDSGGCSASFRIPLPFVGGDDSNECVA